MYCNILTKAIQMIPLSGHKKDHVTISAEQIKDLRFYANKLWYLCTVFRHRSKTVGPMLLSV